MKTAEEKADQLMANLDIKCSISRCFIVTALKEQDRDTRHACAESLSECPIAHPHTSTRVIRLAAAYEKVMNTKTI